MYETVRNVGAGAWPYQKLRGAHHPRGHTHTASRLRRQFHGRLELKGLFSKAFGEADAYCEGPRLCYSGRVKRKCNLLGHDMVVLHTLASCVQEL